MRSVVLALSLLGAASAFAAADDDDPCQQGSAMAISMCNAPKWEAAEKQLQGSYDKVIAQLKSDSPQRVKDMIASQRTWVHFREQYCSVYGRSRVEGNSWTSVWTSECLAAEALSRAKSLQDMLDPG
ncbi:lysozyme inhibitor LprI family protein [Pseudomonas sp. LP_7_YM]|uniref:lysozyme inhibitor LprI family protein n=1 Tax=Pseudomonas sp. LP_7_YM TaxID=2485137 RepID=UPI00105FB6A5|nr:lysozyme inhibitor LprI family protein [Pseudomonas sp. LP_7_YM]TDV70299.1 uncharacterized protein YecT (DUF1311 family) [Pseudomonas sp. LP_7_YM]